MDILINTILGGYRLKRLLGSGGMGSVYLAEDEAIGQQVAIKVIRGEGDTGTNQESAAQAAERFRREARAVASLDHLQILPLYRYGEEETASGRQAYMVMQYRPEGSLWDWLRRRASIAKQLSAPDLPDGLPTDWPLNLNETSNYVRQAASALQYAHERGIVHRDVKPANFLLRVDSPATSSGPASPFLLLSDFGLAKLYSLNSGSSQIFGTPIYMAPEQFEGDAGPACDQYALAVMAYYFLAGHPPFEGEPLQMMHQHLSVAAPPIRQFATHVPAEIEHVLTRALAKKPAERFPSIADFANAFGQHAYDRTPLLLSPGWRQQNRTPLPSGPIISGPALTHSHPQPHEAPTVASATPTPYRTQLQTATQTSVWPAGFPPTPSTPPQAIPTTIPRPADQPVNRRGALRLLIGGTLIVTAGTAIGGLAYHYMNNPTSTTSNTNTNDQPTHIAGNTSNIQYILKGHTGEISSLSWSPDGTQLVSGSLDETARLWEPATTQEATLIYQQHLQAILTVAWNPFSAVGQIASGSRDNTLQVWDVTGVQTHKVNAGAVVNSIAWEGNKAALLGGTQGEGVREVSLKNNKVSQVGNRGLIHALAISPDRHHLAVGSESGYIGIFEFPTLRRIYYERNHILLVKALAWSPDSTQLASAGADRNAQIITISNGKVRTIPHQAEVNGVAWEPSATGRFATIAADGVLRLWNTNDETYSYYQGHKASITAIAWSSHGLATGSGDTTIIIWHV